MEKVHKEKWNSVFFYQTRLGPPHISSSVVLLTLVCIDIIDIDIDINTYINIDIT